MAFFTLATSAKAMSYEQARTQALFLTDKMAYELNLTEEQYEAAFEVNFDYLLNVNTADDLYSAYWTHRNLDLSYILLDWQCRSYVDAAYFYRPLWWNAGYWHFEIYARYPRRNYYYFNKPRVYAVYRGGHSWRMNGGRSYYNGRRYVNYNNRGRMFGMRDGFQRGDYSRGTNYAYNSEPQNPRTRSFGNQQSRYFERNRGTGFDNAPRRSSTRTTVSRGSTSRFGNETGISTFGGSRSFGGTSVRQAPSRSFSPSGNNGHSFGTPNRTFGGGSRMTNMNRGTFGGHR